MSVSTFAPEDIVLTINDYPITDFAEGSFIEVNQNSFNYRQVRGIRGKHTRVRTRDRSGVITLRLMQTSIQNDVLSELAYQDDVNQTGLLFVVLRDSGGSTGVQAVNAYLEGTPNMSFRGSSTTPREWKIYYETLAQYNVSGNSRNVLDIVSNLF